ncbi:MAG: ATP-binding protein, partial [Mariprofundales bacterium]
MPKNKLERMRMLFMPLISLLVISFLFSFFVGVKYLHNEKLEHESMLAMHSANTMYKFTLDLESEKLKSTANILLKNKQLEQAFFAADRIALLEHSRSILAMLEQTNITHIYFHDADQHVLLRTHQPDRYGDLIVRQTLQQAVKNQSMFIGLEIGPLGTLTLRAVTPWFRDGKLIGYLELGAELNKILLRLHDVPNLHVKTLLFKRDLIQKDWETGQRMLKYPANWHQLQQYVISSNCSFKLPPAILNLINSNKIVPNSAIESNGQHYRASLLPIDDAGGNKIAELLVIYNTSHLYTAMQNELNHLIIALLLLGLILLLTIWCIVGDLQKKLNHEIDERIHLNHEHITALSANNKRLIASEKNLQESVGKLHLSQITSLNMMHDMEHDREVAEEALKAKSRFLAMMSHEIRTPLNGILGLAELLLGSAINHMQQEKLHAIYSSGHTLLTVLNDVLDFSKIEAEQLTLNCLPMQINDTIEHVGKLFAASAHQKGLKFACGGLPLLNCFLLGDPDRIQQIIMNLVSNAIKFTDHGEIIISCSLEEETDSYMQLCFAVSDTGIGIAQIAQKKLFEEFFQVDGSHTREYGGSGLGLAISQRIVKMMGGTLSIESIPNKGSRFFFTIKLPKGNPLPDTASMHHDEFIQWRVMVVDDHPANRHIMHKLVTAWGMSNGEAASGEEALQILKQDATGNDPFHLVLLDHMMPEMNGLTLAQEIKADPALAHLKLIMLSSLDDVVDESTMLSHGLDAFLRKPVHQ